MVYIKERDVRERIDYLTRYMHDISPKVSLYAKLGAERKALYRKLSALSEAKNEYPSKGLCPNQSTVSVPT